MDLLFRALHIGFAAAWFGHKLTIPSDVRESASAGDQRARSLVSRLKRSERVGQVSAVGTFLFGGGLIWVVGPGAISPGTWVGTALAVLALGVGATRGRTATRRLFVAIDDDRRADAAGAGAELGRVLATESLLWAGALVAMLI